MTSDLPLPSVLTSRYDSFSASKMDSDEFAIVGPKNSEDRSKISAWDELERSQPNKIIRIIKEYPDKIEYYHDGKTRVCFLRNESSLDEIFVLEKVLIDISAISHNSWAPLLLAARRKKVSVKIMYAEPAEYKSSPAPVADNLFDLSERFEGLRPLPGFTNLIGPDEYQDSIYIPLLGFEGSRPGRLVLDLDPSPQVVPIVGVPGFKMEYPKFTVVSNRVFLANHQAASEIRYARASCPFEAYKTLSRISEDHPESFMYIAPVGTKPHALAAVCYAMNNAQRVELLYDHPIRKIGRSKGVSTIHIFHLAKFDVFGS